MPNHLSPGDLARLLKLDRRDVLAACVATGVPVVHGRIDRTLFQAALQAQTAEQPGVPSGA